MKTSLLPFLTLLLFLVSPLTIYGQSFCEKDKCEECEEAGEDIGEAAGEDAGEEFTAEIGEEGGEMVLGEADMMGAEALETGVEAGVEAGAEVGAEIATEVGTEALAFAAADAIPGVGEVVAVIEVAVILGTVLYELFKKHKETPQEKASGTYLLPLVPQWSHSVDDLSSKQDTFSCVFFLNKKMGDEDVKNYLVKHKQTAYFDKTYDLSELSDYTPKAYSIYTYADNKNHINMTYKRNIPKITFSINNGQKVSQTLQASIKSYWHHVDGIKKVRDLTKTANTSAVRLVLATFIPGEGYVEKANIPYVVEEINDQIAVRIKEYSIKEYANQPLWILLKANAYKDFGKKNGKNQFPTEEGVSEPEQEEKILSYFRVHDYQPKDTPKSIKGKLSTFNGASLINSFPTVHVTDRTQYLGSTIDAPDLGKTHLLLDVPVKDDWKFIEYIELEVVNRALTTIIHLNPKVDVNTVAFHQVKAHYNDAHANGNTLKINQLDFQEDKHIPYIINDPTYIVDLPSQSADTTIWLLQNVPIRSGDIVGVSAYYQDGSHARDVMRVPDTEPLLKRSYYSVKGDNGYLRYEEGVSTPFYSYDISDTDVQWLVEYQGNGAYAIMHRNTKKVLGFQNGTLGMFHWNYEDANLHWHLGTKYNKDFNKDFELINIGQSQSILSSNPIRGTTEEAVVLTFQEHEETEVPPIHKPRIIRLMSVEDALVLDRGADEYPTLSQANYTNSRQLFEIFYMGCLRYALYNPHDEEYFYYDQDLSRFRYDRTKASGWLFEDNNDGLSLRNHLGVLQNINGVISMDLSENPDLSRNKYRFVTLEKHKKIEKHLILHYAYEGNLNDSSDFAHNGTGYSHTYRQDKSPSFARATRRGQVAVFNLNQFTSSPSMEMSPNDGISFGMWIQFEKETSDNTEYVFQFTSEKELLLYRPPRSNDLKLRIKKSLNFYSPILTLPGIAKDPGKWNHILVTSSSDGRIVAYVNGEIATSETNGRKFLGTQGTVYIGNSRLQHRGFIGKIDDFKIWNTPLTSEQAKEEFKAYDDANVLIAHYPLDTDANDISGFAHHGKAKRSFEDDVINRKISSYNDPIRGLVAKFSGKNFIDTKVDFNPKDNHGQLTISCWVKENFIPKSFHILVSNSWSISANLLEGLSRVNATLFNEENNRSLRVKGDLIIEDYQWHHIAMVIDTNKYNQRKISLYIDGILAAEQSGENSNEFDNSSSTTMIGGGNDSPHNFIGLIDDVKIWSSSLNPDQILKEYRSTRKILPSNKLLAHYPFDGYADDHSGNNHHGVALGSTRFEEDITRGEVAVFDRSDDNINLHYDFTPRAYEGDLTIAFWMKTRDFGTAGMDSPPIIMEGSTWSITRQGSSNSIRFSNKAVAGKEHTIHGGNVKDNKWHHVVVITDDKGASESNNVSLGSRNIHNKLYIDGNLIMEKSFDFMRLESIAKTNIGGRGSARYKGKLDDLKIWNYALESKEIKEEYYASKKTFVRKLVGYYPFDNNANDLSGFQHHGIEKGNVTYYNDEQRDLVLHIKDKREYIEIDYGFDPELYEGNMTISVWIKTYRISPFFNNGKRIFYNSFFDIRNNVKGGNFWSSSNVKSFISSSFKFSQIESETNIGNDDKWHHLTTVVDTDANGNTKTYLYIDGVEESSIDVDLVKWNRDKMTRMPIWPTRIGGAFGMYMDDLKIWDAALNPQEIMQEYKITSQNLEAHYAFEHNARDYSGNNYHAHTYGGLRYDTDEVQDGVAVFDGLNDYVDLPNMNISADNGLSIEAWIKFDLNNPTNEECIIDLGNDQSDNNMIMTRGAGNNDLEFRVFHESASLRSIIAPNVIKAGVWMYVVVTVEPDGKAALYVNGQRVSTGNLSVPVAVTRTANFIGKSGHINNYFKGEIGDIKIWKNVMSPEAVAGEYLHSEEQLIGDYIFENNAKDQSQALNHGHSFRGLKYVYDAEREGLAAKFDGDDDYVGLPDLNLKLSNGLSFETWIYFERSKEDLRWLFHENIIDLGNGFEKNNILLSRERNTNNLGFEIYGTNRKEKIIAEEVIVPGAWMYVAATLTASGEAVLYVNGKQVASGYAGIPDSLNRISNAFGKGTLTKRDAEDFFHIIIPDKSHSIYFKGKMDDTKIWQRVLKPEEVLSAYEPYHDLLAAYRFDYDAKDETFRHHDGVLKKNADFVKNSSLDDVVLTLNGDNSYVELPALNINFSEGFSIETWVKFNGNTFDNGESIIDLGNGAFNDNIILGKYGNSNDLTFSVCYENFCNPVVATDVIRPDKWMHIVATLMSDGSVSIYVDGELKVSGKTSIPRHISRNHNYIGKSNFSNNSYLNADINDLKIWERLLSYQDVQSSFRSVKPNQAPIVNNPVSDITAIVDVNYSIQLSDGIFIDPDGDSLTISLTGLPASLSYNASTQTISGAFSEPHTYKITLTADDSYGEQISTSFRFTVISRTNQAPVVNNPVSDITTMVNAYYSSRLPDGIFTDPEGDSLTISVDGLPESLSYDASTQTISGTPTVSDTYEVVLTAEDGHGGKASTDFTMTIICIPKVYRFSKYVSYKEISISKSSLTFYSRDNQGASYRDLTHISGILTRGTNHYLTIGTYYLPLQSSVWIDYNDNGIFETSERIVTNYRIPIKNWRDLFQGSVGTTNLTIPNDARLGKHRMRIKGAYFQETRDPCSPILYYGQTLDFLVHIVDTNSVSSASSSRVSEDQLSAEEVETNDEVDRAPKEVKKWIYPNPGTGLFHLSNLNYADHEVNIKVTGLKGDIIFNQTYKPENEEFILNLTAYNPGIYRLSVYLDGVLYQTETLVKK